MEAPAEKHGYTVLLSPDHSKPDALAVVDLDPGSPNYGNVVHTVHATTPGDEFHHFGWNACSSALSPLSGHPFLQRRYLIVPGLRSSRIYIIDTKPDPREAKIVKVIEPEEVFAKTGAAPRHQPARQDGCGSVYRTTRRRTRFCPENPIAFSGEAAA